MKLAIVLLLISLLALGCECCYIRYPFGNSDCTFEVKYNDLTCTDFTFTKCTFPKCQSGSSGCNQNSSSINGSSISWSFCTQKCCDPGVKYFQNAGAIEQCQAYLDWPIYIKVIISMLSIAAAAAFSVLVSCYCCSIYNPYLCERGRTCCIDCSRAVGRWLARLICCLCLKPVRIQVQPRKRYMLSESEEVFQPPQSLEPKYDKKQNVKRQTSGTWKKGRNHIKVDDACGFCHFNQPQIQLRCQHVFHLRCLIGTARKKQGCSVCGSDSNAIRIYCEDCSLYYFETRLMENLDSLGNSRFTCSNCGGGEVPSDILK